MNKQVQHGLTLVELLLAIALGLLIVAAALSIFLGAQRSLNLQSGLDTLQQNANFGLSMLAYDLRHANLNTASSQKVNNRIEGSGVILSSANLPSLVRPSVESTYFTAQNISNDATGANKSDQITIQFVPELMGEPRYDCEGELMVASRTYVYRYYLEKLPANQQINGALDRFGLYCDSGYYTASMNKIEGLGLNGQLVIQNVDAFKVRFLVKDKGGNLTYATINKYETDLMKPSVVATDFKNIIGVELGVLITSNQSVGAEAHFNTADTYVIAGQTVKLTANPNNSRYLRQPVTQVVALRNTLGTL